jgi:Protein of unknown function (DUF2844)
MVFLSRAVATLPLLLAIALAFDPGAFAVLGEDVSSIRSDTAHFTAPVRIVPKQNYSIHEMQSSAGTTIRQFVSTSGTVFGVSWQGFAPDLQQLLGKYFAEYLTAMNSRHGQRGRGVHLETDNMVLETGGHMRFVVGRAFLRSKLPAGVNADEIR